MKEDKVLFDLEGRLPYSVEAEQAVLGSLIIDPKCITEVALQVKAEYFYIPQHKEIYSAIVSMYELSQSIDFVTLLEKLKRDNVYDEAGGKAYLTQLAQAVPSSANVLSHVAIMKDRFFSRALKMAAQGIIKDIDENLMDSDKLIASAEQRIYDIRSGSDVEGLTHIKSVIEGETYDRLGKLADPETRGDYIGVSSGIGELDKTITGLNKSDLIILGARPGMGKTSFALNIARNVALKSKKTVAFFSLEMTKDQLVSRLLSAEALVGGTKLRTGKLNDEEWQRIISAGDVLSKCDMYLDDTPGISVPAMKAKLRRLKNIDLVVIDYLQLMTTGRHTDNRVQEISEITRNLKVLAKELSVPVICLSQLSRASEKRAEDHRPQISDLRDSGSIEQDADIILFLYREAYYDKNKVIGGDNSEVDQNSAECLIAKNRHGETGTVKLHWQGEFMRFTSPELGREA